MQKGDRVIIYMAMTPEAAMAMLACARIGAIHSVVFGGFAPRELATRIDDAKPKLIICDEAVSALDVSVQAQVIALLDKLRREMGIAFIFIAHDLPVVRDFADHVMVMQKGEVVELGTVREIFETPKQAYTQALLAAGLDPDPDVQAQNRAARLSRAF